MDFDLCQNCVIQIPEETAFDCSSHASSHPMNRFPHPTGIAARIRSREKALGIVEEMRKKTPNTAFRCKGPCGKVDAHGIHFRCIQCDGYILCADCISHETDEGTGHRSTHVFTRFSGEPLAFNETTQETETSDRERLVKIETVLGEMKEQSAMQGNLIKSLAEQLTRQESPIKSLSDALSRGVGDKGIAVTD